MMRARMSSRNGVAVVALLAAIGWSGLSWAADVPVPLESRPLAISSRTMTVKNLDQRVIFEKNVTVIKGDMDLHADRVEVVLAKPSAPSASDTPGDGMGPDILAEGNIERIVADGNVKVLQGTKTVTADHAVYHRDNETVVLTGHPETWEEGVRIAGSKITILLKEQRSIVEESRVVIYPEAGGQPAAPAKEPQGDNGK
jgi:lipopolysaccharide export system protein LptA